MRKTRRVRRAAILLMICLMVVLFGDTPVQAAAKPYMNVKTLSLAKGQSATLAVRNNTKRITWSSSNRKIATVSKKGSVKAVKAGTATITAKIGKKSYKCAVTVSNKSTKVLIVYFSTTGTTQSVARLIQKITGATLVRLQPKTAYTSDYDRLTDIAQNEQDKNARPAIATTIKNWSQYDTVIVGYPIWWGKEPMVIRTFLEKQNWKGKRLLTFCTSGGSGISGSTADIKKSAKGATILKGRDLTDVSTSTIRKWLKARKVN